MNQLSTIVFQNTNKSASVSSTCRWILLNKVRLPYMAILLTKYDNNQNFKNAYNLNIQPLKSIGIIIN